MADNLPFNRKIIAEFTHYSKEGFLKKKYRDKVDIIASAFGTCEDEDRRLTNIIKSLNRNSIANPQNKLDNNQQTKKINKEIDIVRHEGQILQDLFEGHTLEGNTVFQDYANKYLND